MKLIIEKNILFKNLENVTKGLSTRNIIPVLNGIKFEVNSNGILLTASDNDISIEILIDKKDIKKIEEEGSVVIASGNKLLEILKTLSNQDMTIESFDDNVIYFKTNNFEYKSNCFPINDYPKIHFEESDNNVVINSNKLKEMINNTTFACSTQESRPILTGVNLKLVGNIFECVATDTYRLSKMQTYVNNSENNFNIIISSRNISELNKVIDKDTDVKISIFTNKVLFKINNLKFQSSLINGGTFPNTDNSIPKEFSNKFKISLKDFLNIIERASFVTQSKDKNIIDMEIENNKLKIKASSIDIGKIEETIEIENMNNTKLTISYSSKYMLEALKIFNSKNIYLLINGLINPIILKEEDNDELIELVVPMQPYF